MQRTEGDGQVCALQKSKSTRRRKAQDPQAEALPKLTEDEKADIVSQAVEALQDAIQQVGQHRDLLACICCRWAIQSHLGNRPYCGVSQHDQQAVQLGCTLVAGTSATQPELSCPAG